MSPRVPGRTARIAVGATAIAVGVGLVAVCAYFRSLSGFPPYDDEGHLMLAVRHLLDGQTLYGSIATPYGPLYYLEKWLLHGALGIPLTHTAVRLTYAVTYVVTAGVGAIVVFRMTRSLAAAVLALVLLQVPLARFANEPGHPQELATLLLAALPLAATVARPGTRTVLLGLLVGGIVMTKVNVGAFAAAAVGLTLLASISGTPGRALRTAGVLLAVAMPWVVMSGATVPGTVPLSVLVSSWVITVAIVVTGDGEERRRGAGGVVLFVVAAGAAVGALVGFACWKGATTSAIWDALVLRPRVMSGGVTMGFGMLPDAWPTAVLGLAGAVAWRVARSRPGAASIVAVVQVFVGAAIWHRLGYVGFAGILPPWAWLVLVRDGGAAPTARLVLAWLAVLEPLQIFPVPGSQTASGAVPGLLAAVVTLSDGIAGLGRALVPALAPRAATAARALVLAGALWSGWFTLFGVRMAYDSYTPLGLPGTDGVRTSRNDVEMFQNIVRAVDQNCTLLLTVPGVPSLHFWTRARPPTTDLFGHTVHGFRPERLALLQAFARATPGLCVLLGPPRFGFNPDVDFKESLVARMALVRSIDGYRLFVHPAAPPRPPVPGAIPGAVPSPAR